MDDLFLVNYLTKILSILMFLLVFYSEINYCSFYSEINHHNQCVFTEWDLFCCCVLIFLRFIKLFA